MREEKGGYELRHWSHNPRKKSTRSPCDPTSITFAPSNAGKLASLWSLLLRAQLRVDSLPALLESAALHASRALAAYASLVQSFPASAPVLRSGAGRPPPLPPFLAFPIASFALTALSLATTYAISKKQVQSKLQHPRGLVHSVSRSLCAFGG